jgi:hypothetical protein
MSDPNPDDPPSPATPAARETRSIEASRRLSQLLARPLGTPAPPGETPEPIMPRFARPVPPPPAPTTEPADTTASPPPPPAAAAPALDLPWFDRPAPPRPAPEPMQAPEPEPEREAATEPDDDLFDRRDPAPRHAPAEPAGEVWPLEPPARHAPDAGESWPHGPDGVPEWAWPSALDRPPEPAAPAPRTARYELHAAPEPLAPPEPAWPAPSEPPPAPPPVRALDPDAARAIGKIRRLMLVSNLFMLIAIAAVLVVVGYRIYHTEPAAPRAPPPAPVAVPAPPKIPVDMTLTLPRGARIVQTAVAGDRLVLTIEINGASEIRTFDIKTLQPAGRLSFTSVP